MMTLPTTCNGRDYISLLLSWSYTRRTLKVLHKSSDGIGWTAALVLLRRLGPPRVTLARPLKIPGCTQPCLTSPNLRLILVCASSLPRAKCPVLQISIIAFPPLYKYLYTRTISHQKRLDSPQLLKRILYNQTFDWKELCRKKEIQRVSFSGFIQFSIYFDMSIIRWVPKHKKQTHSIQQVCDIWHWVLLSDLLVCNIFADGLSEQDSPWIGKSENSLQFVDNPFGLFIIICIGYAENMHAIVWQLMTPILPEKLYPANQNRFKQELLCNKSMAEQKKILSYIQWVCFVNDAPIKLLHLLGL